MDENIYRKMYLRLFNAVTDAIGLIDKKEIRAAIVLKAAQQECEEMYIAVEE